MTRQEVTSGDTDQGWNADLELVADIEEQTVLLLWPQVVYRSLDTGVSTIASDSQVGAVITGGSEAVQMSVNVVDVEDGDIEGLVVFVSVSTPMLRFESEDFDAVVTNDHGGVGGS